MVIDKLFFRYIQPNGTTSCYLDSLFTHLRHDGVACLVSPDISSQCVRSAPLIQRQYHAHVIKTDYLREMAARIVIGAAARYALWVILYDCLHVVFKILYEKRLVAARIKNYFTVNYPSVAGVN